MGYGSISLKRWAERVHELAKEKGWHDDAMTPRERVAVYFMNIVGEAAEGWEAFRAGRLNEPCDKAEKMKAMGLRPLTCAEEELADVVIRAMDSAEALGIDIEQAVETKHAYNETRLRRHGGKLA